MGETGALSISEGGKTEGEEGEGGAAEEKADTEDEAESVGDAENPYVIHSRTRPTQFDATKCHPVFFGYTEVTVKDIFDEEEGKQKAQVRVGVGINL